jgi:cell division protein FtsL
MSKIFFLLILIIIYCFIYIWQQNTITRFSYKLSNLQLEYDKLVTENDSLQLKINSIISLEKLYKIANEKNFIYHSEKNIININ